MPGKKKAKMSHDKFKTPKHAPDEVSKYVKITVIGPTTHKIVSLISNRTVCGEIFNKYRMGIAQDITCNECKV